jgi:nitroreductase
VRQRLDLERPVPRELVLECIQTAVQAPTGGNRQGWQWLIVTDGFRAAERMDLESIVHSESW